MDRAGLGRIKHKAHSAQQLLLYSLAQLLGGRRETFNLSQARHRLSADCLAQLK
jgi:hypothetical protein